MTILEIAYIGAALTAMKVKPKAETPEDFLQWMTSISKDQEPAVKKEPQDLIIHQHRHPPPFPFWSPPYLNQCPTIATFFGVKQLMTFGSMR